MKFTAPKIIREIPLSEYAPEYGKASIKVWVNPPREVAVQRWTLLQEYSQKNAEDARKYQVQVEQAKRRKTAEPVQEDITKREWFMDWKRRWTGWFANNWSQDADPETHWTVDEVLEMENADPKLARFLLDRTLEMIDDLKKA
jgi:hypothetical protein